MSAILLENFKLIVLALMIGSIIGFSHLSTENLAKMKHAFHSSRWREIRSITAGPYRSKKCRSSHIEI